MSVLAFLSGLSDSSANAITAERERNRKLEDDEFNYRLALLKSLSESVANNPRLDPEQAAPLLSRAYGELANMNAQRGQRRPLAKGMAGFMGKHQQDTTNFDEVLRGLLTAAHQDSTGGTVPGMAPGDYGPPAPQDGAAAPHNSAQPALAPPPSGPSADSPLQPVSPAALPGPGKVMQPEMLKAGNELAQEQQVAGQPVPNAGGTAPKPGMQPPPAMPWAKFDELIGDARKKRGDSLFMSDEEMALRDARKRSMVDYAAAEAKLAPMFDMIDQDGTLPPDAKQQAKQMLRDKMMFGSLGTDFVEDPNNPGHLVGVNKLDVLRNPGQYSKPAPGTGFVNARIAAVAQSYRDNLGVDADTAMQMAREVFAKQQEKSASLQSSTTRVVGPSGTTTVRKTVPVRPTVPGAAPAVGGSAQAPTVKPGAAKPAVGTKGAAKPAARVGAGAAPYGDAVEAAAHSLIDGWRAPSQLAQTLKPGTSQTREQAIIRAHELDPTFDQNEAELLKPNAQIIHRIQSARAIKQHIPDIRRIIQAADAAGALGPIKGRTTTEFLLGKVGSTGNPQLDRVLNDLRTELSNVKSGFAMVHGGARGGGSIQLIQRWDDVLSGKMSAEALQGGLDAVEKWLDTYGKTPRALMKLEQESQGTNGVTPPPAGPNPYRK